MYQPLMSKKLKLIYEDLQDLLELTLKKKTCHFQHRGLKCKSTKSRDTWNNRQVWPLIYTWMSPDGQYWNQIDSIVCSLRWRSSKQWAKTRSGPDYGSFDKELCNKLLIAKFRLKLKKEWETTRPFIIISKSLMIIQRKWQMDSKD